MQNKNKKLFNYNIGSCLCGLFGRYLGFFGASIITTSCLFLSLLISFFGALFLIGNPFLSLSIMFVCFVFLCWNFFRLIQTDLSFLNIVALTSMASFYYYLTGAFIFVILLATKITTFLLILSFLLIFFYPQNGKIYKNIFYVFFSVYIFIRAVFRFS